MRYEQIQPYIERGLISEQAHLAMAREIAGRNAMFTDGIRVLFLIQRHSDGGHTNNSKLRAYITKSSEEWVRALAKLIQEKEQYPHIPLRIYQTINSRSIEKGIREFKHAMLDADYFDDTQRHWFYLDVKNKIISALMKQNCRATSYFLYDVDTQEPSYLEKLKDDLTLHTGIVHTYKTKNGVHVITRPFNHNLVKLPEDGIIEFKKDAMMLLAY